MPVCPETERFAALLRSLKSRSGLSYEALARRSGLAGSTLHRYCRGTSVPQDYGSVHRLATVCGATPEELRTLHRLWALADAARTAAAETGTAETGTAETAPETEEREPGPEEATANPALARTTKPDGAAETDRPSDGSSDRRIDGSGDRRIDGSGDRTTDEHSDRSDGRFDAGPDSRHDAPPRPEPRPDGGPDAGPNSRPDAHGPHPRSHRIRLRTTVVAAVLLATVGAATWTLSNRQASSNSEGDGHGTRDGRPLFSAGCPATIAMGEHDECVKEVQRLLHAKGADIDVDGDFGPQTLRRVTAFQVLAGLRPNGVVEEPTKKALYTSRVRMTVWPEDKVRRRVREVFPEAPDKAVAIADCQSFLDPLHILPNTNGTRNWGLFQISDARLRDLGGTPRQALDPEWNIQAARRLWSRKHDFGDWPHCARAAGVTPSPTSRGSS